MRSFVNKWTQKQTMTEIFQKKLKRNEKVIDGTASIPAIITFIALIEVFLSNIQGKSEILIQPLATSLNRLF